MKLSQLLFGVAFCLILATACDEDKIESYQCDCSYSNGTDTFTDSNLIGAKSSLADAEVDCNAHKTELLNSGATTADCAVSIIM